MLQSLHAVSLAVTASAVVVAALLLVAIKNDAAANHAGGALWKSSGDTYRICRNLLWIFCPKGR